jgi:Pentapeptide repeats (8 copies)
MDHMGEVQEVSGLGWKKDLLDVVLVPLTIAIFGSIISLAQYCGQLNAEDQRAQDVALQAYLDQMSRLMLDDEEPLRSSAEGSEEVRTLARSRTLTVLPRLDRDKKRAVLRFLTEAQLINESDPVVPLAGADFSKANLSEGTFVGAVDVKSSPAVGETTTFSPSGPCIPVVQAPLPAECTDQSRRELVGIDLSAVDLTGANLSRANLLNANLSGANLSGADLSDANLSGANLTNARGVTNEELEKQAKSLEGATMLNGQKYEDWLKDNE